MVFLYKIGIYLYYFILLLASRFNTKAKLWVVGRNNWRFNLRKILNGQTGSIWVHCASLGEFEQGRPIIESLKVKYPNKKILLTFFSPSGFEVRKNYQFADYVFYLPLDTKSNAFDFIDIVKPDIVFFVKYEFWYFFLKELKKRNVPLFLFSAIFRQNQPFFKWYGAWWKSMLYCYTHIFVQNSESSNLLLSIGIKNQTLAGDTRFDRVYQIAESSKSISIPEKFKNNHPVLIAGSTWPKDENILIEYILADNSDWKYIIAPHQIEENNIKNILSKLKNIKVHRFTDGINENISQYKVLIIDNVGLLSSLYKYGNVAYIGGGFGSGIHNTLEAAVFGMPVVFGPKYSMFQEANDLINLKAAFSITNLADLILVFDKIKSDQAFMENTSLISKKYVKNNTGATNLILNHIQNFL